ncbi:MAG: CapA family protein [Patescibacteria group bacterium]|jgi:poly-gamma-glutamate synthesis protein (capsule biosynthesis protein)
MKDFLRIILVLVLATAGILSLIPYLKTNVNNDVASLSPPVKEKVKEKDEIRILFAGDFMFDRYIREMAQKKGNDFILEQVEDVLAGNDLVVVNLESPITTFPSRSIGSKIGSPENYVFTADPSVAATLFNHNIRLVNLGNNHILNFGTEGLAQTKAYLDQNGINYFGSDDKAYEIINFEGYKIGFVGYNQFSTGSKERAIQAISQLVDSTDFVVLYTHWGNEYITTSEQTIRDLAHEFKDKGADLIIGSHPHVVQQKEVYKGKTIYYSLGNFIMDQYFDENVRNGLLVILTINISTNDQRTEEIPVEMTITGQTVLKR